MSTTTMTRPVSTTEGTHNIDMTQPQETKNPSPKQTQSQTTTTQIEQKPIDLFDSEIDTQNNNQHTQQHFKNEHNPSQIYNPNNQWNYTPYTQQSFMPPFQHFPQNNPWTQDIPNDSQISQYDQTQLQNMIFQLQQQLYHNLQQQQYFKNHSPTPKRHEFVDGSSLNDQTNLSDASRSGSISSTATNLVDAGPLSTGFKPLDIGLSGHPLIRPQQTPHLPSSSQINTNVHPRHLPRTPTVPHPLANTTTSVPTTLPTQPLPSNIKTAVGNGNGNGNGSSGTGSSGTTGATGSSISGSGATTSASFFSGTSGPLGGGGSGGSGGGSGGAGGSDRSGSSSSGNPPNPPSGPPGGGPNPPNPPNLPVPGAVQPPPPAGNVKHVRVCGHDARANFPDFPKLQDKDHFAEWENAVMLWFVKFNINGFWETTRANMKLSQVMHYTNQDNVTEALQLFNIIEQKICSQVLGGVQHLIADVTGWLQSAQYNDIVEGTRNYDFQLLWARIKREFDKRSAVLVRSLEAKFRNTVAHITDEPREFYRQLEIIELQLNRAAGTTVFNDIVKQMLYRDKLPKEFVNAQELLEVQVATTGQPITAEAIKNLHINLWEQQYGPMSSGQVSSDTHGQFGSTRGKNHAYHVDQDDSDDQEEEVASSDSEEESEEDSSEPEVVEEEDLTALDRGIYDTDEQYILAVQEWKINRNNKRFTNLQKRFNEIKRDKANRFKKSANQQSKGKSNTIRKSKNRNSGKSSTNPSFTTGKNGKKLYVMMLLPGNVNSINSISTSTSNPLFWVADPRLVSEEFLLDTGSFNHVVKSKLYAIPGTLKHIPPVTITAFASTRTCTQTCDVYLTREVIMKDCLIIESANANLVSGVRLLAAGYVMAGEGSKIEIIAADRIPPLLTFELHGSSFSLFRDTKEIQRLLKQSTMARIKPSVTEVDKIAEIPSAEKKVIPREKKKRSSEKKKKKKKSADDVDIQQQDEEDEEERLRQAVIDKRAKLAAKVASKSKPKSVSRSGSVPSAIAPSSSNSSSSSSSSQHVSTRINPSYHITQVLPFSYRVLPTNFFTNEYGAVPIHHVTDESLDILHQQYGHQSLTPKQLRAIGIHYTSNYNPALTCPTCLLSKAKKAAIHSVANYPGRATELIELIHADVVGPISNTFEGKKIQCSSYNNKLYFLTLVDDYTGYIVVIPFRSKTEVPELVKSAILWLQTSVGKTVKRLHTDGGTEFVNEKMTTFVKSLGITHTQSTPYTPQHNGTAERANGKVVTMNRSLLQAMGGGPLKLWSYSVCHAANILNLTPHSSHEYRIPFATLFSYRPSISKFGIFGQDCYIFIEKPYQGKLEDTAEFGMYLGYNSAQNGSVVLNPFTMKVRVSISVKYADSFYCAKLLRGEISSDKLTSILSGVIFHDGDKPDDAEDFKSYSPIHDDKVIHDEHEEEELYEVEKILDYRKSDKHYLIKWKNYDETTWVPEENLAAPDAIAEYKRSLLYGDEEAVEESGSDMEVDEDYADGEDIAEQEVKEDHMDLESHVPIPIPQQPSAPIPPLPIPSPPPILRRSNRRRQPSRPAGLLHVTDQPQYVMSISSHPAPKNFQEAINGPEADLWIKSMDEEYFGFLEHNIGEEIIRQPGMVIIDGKWIYKIKEDKDGNILKRKSRYVIRGFSQIYGVNFTDTYAPVVRGTSLKIQLLIAVLYDCDQYQLDVTQAFLHADLSEDTIYCELPQGYGAGSKYVWKLNKALYGLKQAPREWYKKISTLLLSTLEYKNLYNDPCLFYKHIAGSEVPIIISLYVDDSVIIVPPTPLGKSTWVSDQQVIKNEFKVSDLGEPQFVLNMTITRLDDGSIHLSNITHINKVIATAGLIDCKTSKSPYSNKFIDSISPENEDSDKLNEDDHHLFRAIQGQVGYITGQTRPDLSVANYISSTKLASPTTMDLKRLLNIVRYIADTPTHGIVLRYVVEDFAVRVWTDANWGATANTKSITGMLVDINGSFIEWSSSKQETTALSSSESELKALVVGCQAAIWIRHWFNQVLQKEIIPTLITDNKAALELGKEAKISKRSKHLSIQDAFVRERVSLGHVTIKWVSSEEQLADGLTKILTGPKFTKFRDQVVTPLPPSSLHVLL